MYRSPPLFSNADREDLLNLDGDGLEYISSRWTISLKAETNIFRSEWDLCVDPHATPQETRELGLVERASIWRKNVQDLGYEVLVVLLDPLPTIRISRAWTLQIPMMSAEADSDGVDVSDSDDRDDHHDYSIGSNDGTGTQQVLIIEGDGNVEELAIPIENPRRHTRERPALRWLRRQPNRDVDRRKVNVKTNVQVLVKQMAPRKVITIDLEKALLTGESLAMLQEELNETKSTRQEVHDIVHTQGMYGDLFDIVLFNIIRQDTSTLLQVLSQLLSDMEIDILDDTKMEDRLGLWRQLIRKADRELSELKASAKSFLKFFGVSYSSDASVTTADDFQTFEDEVSKFFKEIDQMLERLRRASASLTSNMGILDSRRSIDEAHAVTRLTELAFIFIPLTFSTSIFGMQIEPFKDPAPLWNFFVVAVTVTIFAYLMRLTMRSQWLASTKQMIKKDIRRYAEQHSIPVQVRSLSMLLLLQWFGRTLERSGRTTLIWTAKGAHKAGTRLWRTIGFPISFIVVIGIVAAAPIAVLWTRDLDRGVQGSVTAVIMVALLGLVGIPFWRRYDSEYRSAFPKFIIGLVKRIPPTARFLLLLALGIVIFVAIPLSLIWTRPLPSGIKAGLTAAILVVLVTGIGYLWMRRLFSSFVSNFSEGSSEVPSDASADEVVQRAGTIIRRL
ncbi:hypothetical protein BDV59DRAFT_175637 [Aspergillus ambiguus]|uniref:uncharacterized protein n=1 Tax=Aspergillus ambiguus TaxID=176160 RepID=UPI003CCDDE81